MTNQEKKEWLKRYEKLDILINQKTEELARLRALCEKVTASISDMPKGGGADKDESYARLIDFSDEINADIDKYVDMRREIETAIKTVPDFTLQNILRLRYIEHNTWEQIAVTVDKSYRQVCRWHGKALEQIKIGDR